MKGTINAALGADGMPAPDAVAGKIIDATAGGVTVNWTGFTTAANVTISLEGSSATTLRPQGVRYLLIQPRGGPLELRLGTMGIGVVIADGDRYTIPAFNLPSLVFQSGPAVVYVEAGL